MPPNRRSKLQKARAENHTGSAEKENSPSAGSASGSSGHTLAAVELELKRHRARGKDYERHYRLEHRKVKQSYAKCNQLCSEASMAYQSHAETQQ